MLNPGDGSQPAGEPSANHARGEEAHESGDDDDPVVRHGWEDNMLDVDSQGDLGSGLATP